MDNLCFGMEYLNITQLPGGSYSHANQAVDLGGRDTGKDIWYARGETYWKCTCCWYSGTNTYHFLSCDSKGKPIKVHCADGKDRVVTVSLTHDLNKHKIGRLYHNEKMYQEGTKYPYAGKVTGNHIHLEIAEGDVRKRYKAKNGAWTLYNELNPLEVMFVDDSFTKVINTKGAVLKHCSDITYKGDEAIMNLNDGFQSLTYSGANLKVYKGYDKFKKLFMLSALGNEKATQDIRKFDHSNLLIMADANCNYFEMASKTEYGQHYGVEQSIGDDVHTSGHDLAPKNSAYEVFYELTNGECGRCTADNYWYSKSDVNFACTPYATVVFNHVACNHRSSAFGNKDNYANSQTMFMKIKDAWCIVCTGSKVLPKLMQNFALDCNADYAFLVDSGGSTQMMAYINGKWTDVIYTGRHIPNVLALGAEKDSKPVEPSEPTTPTEPTEETISKAEYDKVVNELNEAKADLEKANKKLDDIKKIIEE
nr:MAG TPA: Morphogenesis protein 1 hydrolase [Caudoviricetes sp.]